MLSWLASGFAADPASAPPDALAPLALRANFDCSLCGCGADDLLLPRAELLDPVADAICTVEIEVQRFSPVKIVFDAGETRGPAVRAPPPRASAGAGGLVLRPVRVTHDEDNAFLDEPPAAGAPPAAARADETAALIAPSRLDLDAATSVDELCQVVSTLLATARCARAHIWIAPRFSRRAPAHRARRTARAALAMAREAHARAIALASARDDIGAFDAALDELAELARPIATAALYDDDDDDLFDDDEEWYDDNDDDDLGATAPPPSWAQQ